MISIVIIPDLLKRDTRDYQKKPYRIGSPASEYMDKRYQNEEWRFISSRCGRFEHTDLTNAIPEDGEEITVVKVIEAEAIVGALIAAGWYAWAAYAVVYGGMLALSIGLSMAISAMMAPSIPTHGRDGTMKDSPTYGWGGTQNTANAGIPLGIVYGKNVIGGNFINTYVESVKYKNYLNVLIALGEGKVYSVGGITADTDDADIDVIGDKIKVNGNPINNYRDAKVYVRLGSDVQDPIPIFPDLHDVQDHNIHLLRNVRHTFTTRNSDVNDIGLRLYYPQVGTMDSDTGELTVENDPPIVYWRYRIHSDPDVPGSWSGWNGVALVGKKSRSGLWQSIRISDSVFMGSLLPANQYDITIYKASANSSSTRITEIYLESLDEIKSYSLSYPNTALIGIRLLATDEISGSLDSVMTEVEGLEIDTYPVDDTPVHEYSNNPAWCTLDLMTNKRYGLGDLIDVDKADLVSFREASVYCDELVALEEASGGTEKRFELDMVLDGESKAIDLLSLLCGTFRCVPFWSMGRVKLVVDMPSVPVQLFTMGNIVADSFSEAFTSIQSIDNLIEVEFLNRDDDYIRDVIQVEDEVSIIAGDPIHRRNVFIPGITRQTQAARMGRYFLNHDKLITRSIDFKAFIDAIVCQAGDVINFSHDVPQWGDTGGRVGTGSGASTIVLSEAITLDALSSGESRVVKVRHSDDTIETKTVTSPAGDYAAGDPISISGTWASNPSNYDVYVIGISTTVTKPFRIMEMTRTSEHEVAIKAVEYDEDVFSDVYGVKFPDQYTNLPDPRRLPQPVENLTATTQQFYDALISLSFDIADADADYGFIDHVEVHQMFSYSNSTSTVGGYEMIGTFTEQDIKLYNLVPGRRYWFKVIPVSKWGVRLPDDQASETSIVAQPPILKNIRGLELVDQGNDFVFTGKDATFTWKHAVSVTAKQPVGQETQGAGSGTLDSYISHYHVKIWNWTVNKGREFDIKDNVFAYTYAMNKQDMGTPQRSFHIYVWVVDKYNQWSDVAHPAHIEVNNPRPSPPSNVKASFYAIYQSGWKFQKLVISWDLPATIPDLVGFDLKRTIDLGPANISIWQGSATNYTEVILDAWVGENVADVMSQVDYTIASIDSFEDIDYLLLHWNDGNNPLSYSGWATKEVVPNQVR